MRATVRCLTVLVILGSVLPAPPVALADSLDKTADRVFGQPGFGTSDFNHGGLNARGLQQPTGAVLDRQGNLYVADATNNRVLVYDAPLSTHQAASVVLGQPDVFTNTFGQGPRGLDHPFGLALDSGGNLYVADPFNNRVLIFDAPLTTHEAASHVIGQPDLNQRGINSGGLNARSLNQPYGVAVDDQDNVYIADTDNSRVLVYSPITSDQPAADFVLGQPSLITNTANSGGLNADNLDSPVGVAVDEQHNVYVADTNNHRVLQYIQPLDTHQNAHLVIGQPNFITNTANNGNLNASASGLNLPFGVTVDAQGNLYVADTFNNRVLEYNTPLATDAAADHVFGQPDLTSRAPNNPSLGADSLVHPTGVTVDAAGNLIVADIYNNRVLEYDLPLAHPAPVLTSVAPTTVAAGSLPFRLTVNGTAFVASSVVRWTGASLTTHYWSSTQLFADVPGGADVSGGPFDISVFTPGPGGGASSVKSLSLYSRVGHDIQADAEFGQPSFGTNDTNSLRLLADSRLDGEAGVALLARTGRLFVVDENNQRILSWPSAAAQANGQPADLALGQPNLLESTPNNGGRSARTLRFPIGVTLDPNGNVYVADSSNNRVLEYDAPLSTGMAAARVFGQSGSFTTSVSNKNGLGPNSLSGPSGLALDGAGRLYVVDAANNRVLEYDSPLTSQTANRVFGQPDFTHKAPNNGGVNNHSLNDPASVALDSAGHLYVADFLNNRVLEFDNPLTSQLANHVFGQPDFMHAAINNNGSPSRTGLYEPSGLALDGQGNLYVADFFNQRVLEYDAPLTDPSADRVFGQADFGQHLPNRGLANPSPLSLFGPVAVAVDGHNNLYVSDEGNNRVLEYQWAAAALQLPVMMH